MQNIRFIPYEELMITCFESGEYLLETPWLSLKIQVEAENEMVHETLRAYSMKNLESVNFQVLSDFLKELALPFYYILPSAIVTATDSHANLLPQSLMRLSKSEFRKFLGLSEVSPRNQDWMWDAQAILDFSKVGSQYAPDSILSVVRRFHHLDCIEYDNTSKLYDYCRTQNFIGSQLSETLATIVYQNYFVTAQCQTSLQPALRLSLNAKNTLLDFMQDEEGHDLLMLRAVNTLHPKMSSLYLAQSTKNIMEILKRSGDLNFLSFCLAIDFFEKPNHGETDPLAELLAYHNKVAAADCLQKHKDINDGGSHEAVALEFLKHMKTVDLNYALFAIRLSELLTDEMTSVTAELLDFFNQNRAIKNA